MPSSDPASSSSGSARSATKKRPRPPHRRRASSTMAALTSVPITSAPSSRSHAHCAPAPHPASRTRWPVRGMGTSDRSAGRSKCPLKAPASVASDHTGASRS